MAVNGVPNLAIDSSLRFRLRQPLRVDGTPGPSAGAVEAPGAPRPGAAAGSPATGGGAPAGVQPGAAANPLAGATNTTPGSGQPNGSPANGNNGANGTGGQQGAGAADGAHGSGGGEGGSGSGGNGNGSGAAAQGMVNYQAAFDQALQNAAANNTAPGLPGADNQPAQNPLNGNGRDFEAFQELQARALAGDPEAQKQLADFTQKAIVEPAVTQGDTLLQRTQEAERKFAEKGREAKAQRELNQMTDQFSLDVGNRVKFLRQQAQAEAFKGKPIEAQLNAQADKLQDKREQVGKQMKAYEQTAHSTEGKEVARNLQATLDGRRARTPRPGAKGKAGDGMTGGKPKQKSPFMFVRNRKGDLTAVARKNDGQVQVFTKPSPKAPPKGKDAAPKPPADPRLVANAAPSGKGKDKVDPAPQRDAAADACLPEEDYANLVCSEPETEAGDEFRNSCESGEGQTVSQGDEPEAERTPAERHPAEATDAEVRAAGNNLLAGVSREDRKARLEADKNKLAAASRMRRAVAEEYVAQAGEQGTGAVAGEAMVRGRNQVFRQAYREEQLRTAQGVLGGRPLRGVVYCDNGSRSVGRTALAREAADGNLAGLSVPPEQGARILALKPGDEGYAEQRAQFARMTVSGRPTFVPDSEGWWSRSFAHWQPDPGRARHYQTAQVATGGERA